MVRAAWRTLDGALLLALGWVARCWPRGRRGQGVVLVTNTMAIGGAQRQILLWLRHRAAGYAPVRLVLLTGGGVWDAEGAKLGVPVEVVEEVMAPNAWGRCLLAALPRTAYVWALCRRLRRHRPATVWSWLFLANVVTAPAARLAGVPRLLVSERGLSHCKWRRAGGSWWYRRAEQNAAALSDAVVVNARAVAHDYSRWLGRSPESIRVVVNGIEPRLWPEARRPAGTPEERRGRRQPVVLSVGRLSPEKAPEHLLRVCARLLREGVDHRLVFVGGGELYEALGALTRALGVADRVVLAREQPEPKEYYRHADVFALSSVAEGMPNALMEAQVCGLPAVTTDAGGAGEVVVDGETGFVVPVGDEAAFAAALKGLLEDPELRRRMGEAGRRRMLEVFPLERMVREIDQVFAELGVFPHDAGGNR